PFRHLECVSNLSILCPDRSFVLSNYPFGILVFFRVRAIQDKANPRRRRECCGVPCLKVICVVVSRCALYFLMKRQQRDCSDQKQNASYPQFSHFHSLLHFKKVSLYRLVCCRWRSESRERGQRRPSRLTPGLRFPESHPPVLG